MRLGRHLLGELGDVVVGHRADRAQGLRHDQVRLQLAEQVTVELVDRLAAFGVLAYRGVDVARGQPGREDIARDLGQVAGLRREVTLVRDRDNLATETEREQQLGGMGNEADDAHSQTVRQMTLLSDREIQTWVAGSAWERDGDAITRDRKLPDFAAAVDFTNRVAALAEEANHHPDILIHGWNKVRLTLSTHSQGGITAADLALAERIDGLR